MATAEERFGKDIVFNGDFRVSPSGDLQTIEGQQNVTARLTRRTLTEPGTLVHRPDFGVGIKRFLNSLNSLENQRELANRIKVQWEQDEDVEKVLGISFQVEDNKPEQAIISVRVDLVGVKETILRIISGNTRVV